MTSAIRALAIALLPGGLLALAAHAVLHCRHRVEVASRLADGGMGRACVHCGRTRPHPWAGEPVRHHQTLGPRPAMPTPPPPATGIEREAALEKAEDAAISAELRQIERRERFAVISARVTRQFQRRA